VLAPVALRSSTTDGTSGDGRRYIVEAVCVEAEATATVQEVHMVALHLVCAAVDRAVGLAPVPAVSEVA